MLQFYTKSTPVQELEPGDSYLWGSYPAGYESRAVLGVLSHGPSGSALLEVRKPDGNTTRTHLCGSVSRLVGQGVRCV